MHTPLPPLTQIPADLVAASDYETYAQPRMTASAWAYLHGAAADEQTAAANQQRFEQWRLCPSVLRDLRQGHTRLELFGHRYEHPVLLAPVAHQKLAHVDGELASVTAAAAMSTGMVVSTQASVSLEDIAARAGTAPLWFQLYIQHDKAFTQQLVQRAEKAGYRALVVTVDAPVSGIRNREQRARFALPPGVEAVNLRGMQAPPYRQTRPGENPLFACGVLEYAPVWQDIAWLKQQTSLPVLLKGILSPQDARLALEYGADGLIVSNHGGRTLDGLPATIDALPAIVQAVNGQVPVLMDGGIRRGTDILKALALGATAVMVGRPYVYALAAAGSTGVAHLLHLLRAELEVAMALCGCRTLADIKPSSLWPERW